MDNKNAFAAWLISARRKNGKHYAESTQDSYIRAFRAAAHAYFTN